jgi:hypothetical protein
VATVGIAAIFALILPNGLHSIKGFSELEREYLQWNFGKDLGQQDNTDEYSAWKGLVMAVQDPKTWLLMAVLWSVCFLLSGLVTDTDVNRVDLRRCRRE